MADERQRGEVIPTGFLTWIQKPLQEAQEACQRVPLRLDEHRAWLDVFRAVSAAQRALMDLHKLAAWCNIREESYERKTDQRRVHGAREKTARGHQGKRRAARLEARQ